MNSAPTRFETQTMQDRPLITGVSFRRLVVFAAPLAWAVLILFHPMPQGDDAYGGLKDDVDLWLVVHVGQLILTPFLFLAVLRLLDGARTVAATVSRCALVVWAVFFSAYDAVQGIATGVITKYANDLPANEQSAVAGAIDFIVLDSKLAGNVSFLQLVAGASWLTVAIAAAVALHQAGAGGVVVAAAAISTVFSAHVAPAAIGLLALCVAGVLNERHRTTRRSGAVEQPSVSRA